MKSKIVSQLLGESYDPAGAGDKAARFENAMRAKSVAELQAFKKRHLEDWQVKIVDAILKEKA